jgi:hypothetical protein
LQTVIGSLIRPALRAIRPSLDGLQQTAVLLTIIQHMAHQSPSSRRVTSSQGSPISKMSRCPLMSWYGSWTCILCQRICQALNYRSSWSEASAYSTRICGILLSIAMMNEIMMPWYYPGWTYFGANSDGRCFRPMKDIQHQDVPRFRQSTECSCVSSTGTHFVVWLFRVALTRLLTIVLTSAGRHVAWR